MSRATLPRDGASRPLLPGRIDLHRRRLAVLLGAGAALRPGAADAQAQRDTVRLCEGMHGEGVWTGEVRLRSRIADDRPATEILVAGHIETPRSGHGLRLRLDGWVANGAFVPRSLTAGLTGDDPFAGAGATPQRPALATLTVARQVFLGPAPVSDRGTLQAALSSPIDASPRILANLAFLARSLREGRMVELTLRLPGGRELSYAAAPDGFAAVETWLVRQEAQQRAALRAGTCRAALPGDGPCFITTACCDLIGLPDDAWELRALRRFRDRHLAAMPGGGADIAAYYAEAPRILARIAADPAREQVLARLYRGSVLPSAVLARLGLHRAARRRYTRMMAWLAARYPGR